MKLQPSNKQEESLEPNFSTRRLAAFAVSNSCDANDFIQTIRHEILGYFGLNTFKPSEKNTYSGYLGDSQSTDSM